MYTILFCLFLCFLYLISLITTNFKKKNSDQHWMGFKQLNTGPNKAR
jgi:hypothetical protein